MAVRGDSADAETQKSGCGLEITDEVADSSAVGSFAEAGSTVAKALRVALEHREPIGGEGGEYSHNPRVLRFLEDLTGDPSDDNPEP
jgi:hypothetical protein